MKDFGGDAIAANLLPAAMEEDLASIQANGTLGQLEVGDVALINTGVANLNSLLPGQIGGIVTDPQGAVVAGAHVTVTSLERGTRQTATTDSGGHWVVSGIPTGTIKVETRLRGFQTEMQDHINYDANQPFRLSSRLNVGTTTSTVEVTSAASPAIADRQFEKDDRDAKKAEMKQQNAASSNVLNLQKRVAGVLPVRIDVPRAGNSYRFARALVLDEETKVTFNYKSEVKSR